MRRISGVNVFVTDQLKVFLFQAGEGLFIDGAVGGGFALLLVEAADGFDQRAGFVGAAVRLEGLTLPHRIALTCHARRRDESQRYLTTPSEEGLK
jgi:hypothetical protein